MLLDILHSLRSLHSLSFFLNRRDSSASRFPAGSPPQSSRDSHGSLSSRTAAYHIEIEPLLLNVPTFFALWQQLFGRILLNVATIFWLQAPPLGGRRHVHQGSSHSSCSPRNDGSADDRLVRAARRLRVGKTLHNLLTEADARLLTKASALKFFTPVILPARYTFIKNTKHCLVASKAIQRPFALLKREALAEVSDGNWPRLMSPGILIASNISFEESSTLPTTNPVS